MRCAKRRRRARRWPPALFILPLLLQTTALGITQNLSVIMFFTVLEDCFRKMFQIKMSMFMLNWAQVYGFRSIFPWVPDLHTFFILHGCKSCLIKVRMWHNCADLTTVLSGMLYSFTYGQMYGQILVTLVGSVGWHNLTKRNQQNLDFKLKYTHFQAQFCSQKLK